ncbi:DUF3223 domain-containing protein [Aliikangiella sp. IMCC44359]|uniref:DUF3223 domain-containing protein n=1 Tax=Aliikangiella sp. IMCC44359 TaxID=3459125 RepID=UPI00403AABB2
MAKRIPVTLSNGREFPTKTAALDYFKRIVNSVAEIISKDHEYYSDVLSLYLRHPEFTQKSRNVDFIKCFQIKNSGQFNTKCLHTIHIDGTETDWSYKVACDSKQKSLFNCFVDGARLCLEEEYPRFRDDSFTLKCKEFVKLHSHDGIVPLEWISEPNKIQYRTILKEPIKQSFLSWYRKFVIMGS